MGQKTDLQTKPRQRDGQRMSTATNRDRFKPANHEWHSINAGRNVRLLEVGCEELGIDREVVLNSVPERLRGKEARQMVRGEDVLTLDEYNDAVDEFVRQAGHVSFMREIGRHSPLVDFGFDKIKRLFGTNPVTGRMISPWAAYGMLNSSARAWNINKIWQAKRRGINGVRLTCTYSSASPTGTTVDPLEDAVSLLHLIRGMNEALPGIFPGRTKNARVHYTLVALPIVKVLKMWAPDALIALDNGHLLFNGQVVGEKVYLIPDKKGVYWGNYLLKEPEHNKWTPGIVLTQDVTTPCSTEKGGTRLLPIVYEGDVFQIEEGSFNTTVIDVEWNTTLLERLLGPLFALMGLRSLNRRGLIEVQDENELIAANQRTAHARREAEINASVASVVFPDEIIFRDVINGSFSEAEDEETVALVVDVVDFSKMCHREELGTIGGFMKTFMTVLNGLATRHFGKINNFTGDGAVILWSSKMGLSRGLPVEERVELTIKVASSLCEIADRAKHPIRVGISMGPTVTYTIPIDQSGNAVYPVTNGDAVNMAARVEAGTKSIQQHFGTSVAGIDGVAVEKLSLSQRQRLSLTHSGKTQVKSDFFELWMIERDELGEAEEAAVRTASISLSSMGIPAITELEIQEGLDVTGLSFGDGIPSISSRAGEGDAPKDGFPDLGASVFEMKPIEGPDQPEDKEPES